MGKHSFDSVVGQASPASPKPSKGCSKLPAPEESREEITEHRRAIARASRCQRNAIRLPVSRSTALAKLSG
jgi:hypothetical protein